MRVLQKLSSAMLFGALFILHSGSVNAQFSVDTYDYGGYTYTSSDYTDWGNGPSEYSPVECKIVWKSTSTNHKSSTNWSRYDSLFSIHRIVQNLNREFADLRHEAECR